METGNQNRKSQPQTQTGKNGQRLQGGKSQCQTQGGTDKRRGTGRGHQHRQHTREKGLYGQTMAAREGLPCCWQPLPNIEQPQQIKTQHSKKAGQRRHYIRVL